MSNEGPRLGKEGSEAGITERKELEEAGGGGKKIENEGTLFIKRVAIKDFLTYQDFEMENSGSAGGLGLSAGCNLVLGKNGSGKSSFLNAIIYVLSDKFSSMTKHQKRGLLNNIAQ